MIWSFRKFSTDPKSHGGAKEKVLYKNDQLGDIQLNLWLLLVCRVEGQGRLTIFHSYQNDCLCDQYRVVLLSWEMSSQDD